ncbi:MAG: acetate--CoA ligase family protein, partial [Anaerolineae bacterium]|nr:acetate--CoA ligase family protein [Anaerolineae bacterium]
MRLLEYESKLLLREAGLETPAGRLATSPAEAEDIAKELGGPAVLKPQVPFGGRGKAGALAFAEDPGEVAGVAERLLSTPLRGHQVQQLLVEQRVRSRQELFLGITYDTSVKRPVLLASPSGGVEIEAVAETVHRHLLPLHQPWPTFLSREVAAGLGLAGRPLLRLTAIIDRLVAAFLDLDALLVEINPLILTPEGQLVAVDAHIELDDDALYRHKELAARLDLAGRGQRPLTDFERKAAEIDHADHRGVAG